jgi:hypothetical protein
MVQENKDGGCRYDSLFGADSQGGEDHHGMHNVTPTHRGQPSISIFEVFCVLVV